MTATPGVFDDVDDEAAIPGPDEQDCPSCGGILEREAARPFDRFSCRSCDLGPAPDPSITGRFWLAMSAVVALSVGVSLGTTVTEMLVASVGLAAVLLVGAIAAGSWRDRVVEGAEAWRELQAWADRVEDVEDGGAAWRPEDRIEDRLTDDVDERGRGDRVVEWLRGRW